MGIGRGLKGVVAGLALAGTALVAPAADAGGYTMDIRLDGVERCGLSEGGNASIIYTLKGYEWGQPGAIFPRGVAPELTFTHTVDKTSAALLRLAERHEKVRSAELHVNVTSPRQATLIVLRMSDVQFIAVRELGAASSPEAQPDETVTIRFKQISYSYSPLRPDGTPAGPPVTFAISFGDRDHDHDRD
jgi:hypothetical protein